MEPVSSATMGHFVNTKVVSTKVFLKDESHFQRILGEELNPGVKEAVGKNPIFAMQSPAVPSGIHQPASSMKQAAAAYQKQEDMVPGSTAISALQKYKDDQLLSNPGGDHYDLEQKRVINDPHEQDSFWGRVGKDISDAFSNVKNFFHNLFFGSKFCYRDKQNQIQEARQRGFIGSVQEFFKDLGSALSFGAWRPDGEAEPQGFVKRAGFFFSKMKEAIFGDLVQGVSASIIHMGEDLLFAGWNLLEAIPDATIGNFQAGKKITTKIFDNGQVVLDYLTDIIPSGDAWVRVHSPNIKKLAPPIFHNIKRPEYSEGDSRWQYVRNTPFRKAIETAGSLIMDVLSFWWLGRISLFGEKRD